MNFLSTDPAITQAATELAEKLGRPVFFNEAIDALYPDGCPDNLRVEYDSAKANQAYADDLAAAAKDKAAASAPAEAQSEAETSPVAPLTEAPFASIKALKNKYFGIDGAVFRTGSIPTEVLAYDAESGKVSEPLPAPDDDAVVVPLVKAEIAGYLQPVTEATASELAAGSDKETATEIAGATTLEQPAGSDKETATETTPARKWWGGKITE